MTRVLKWLGRGALVFVALLFVAAGVVYAVSERRIGETYDVPVPDPVEVPSDTASIANGERLARIYGCYAGCHGSRAEGELFMDDAAFMTINAPDLTRAVRSMSVRELDRLVRHGVRPDNRPVWVMPSSSFYHLTDDDFGSILAFLRSLPASDGPERSVRMGPIARGLLAARQFESAAAMLDHDAPPHDPGDGSDPLAVGRYLAFTACAECHGHDLLGVAIAGFETPNLAIVRSYGPEEFRTLLRTGEPRSDTPLELMALMAEKRFSLFTDAEIDGLYAYLSTMGATSTD